MLTINQTTSYNKNSNIHFKSKTNYEKIYKEMEKITVKKEEKILRKTNIKDNLLDIKSNVKKILNKTGNNQTFQNFKNRFGNFCRNMFSKSASYDPFYSIMKGFTFCIAIFVFVLYSLDSKQDKHKNEQKQEPNRIEKTKHSHKTLQTIHNKNDESKLQDNNILQKMQQDGVISEDEFLKHMNMAKDKETIK